MSRSVPRPPVTVILTVEDRAGTEQQELVIDRAQWDDLTPAGRTMLIDAERQDMLYDLGISSAWSISDTNDFLDTQS